MPSSALIDAKNAWDRTYYGLSQKEISRRAQGLRSIVRGIFRDGLVSAESFARERGVETSEARALFSALADFGMQFDESGNIVGAALTETKTPHALRIGTRKLYAWCALDSLFIPGFLGETAQVESTCPGSGAQIQLTVTPEGVTDHVPCDAVVSIFMPGHSGARIGLASPT